MKLFIRPEDDLNWSIEEDPKIFEFVLGSIPLEDELYFNALAVGLGRFSTEVWPKFPASKAILYRGEADFSKNFLWTERQEANFLEWLSGMPEGNEAHQKRLFCAEVYIHYFQMLAHKLPDEIPLILHLEAKEIGTLAETFHLLSPERFEHFELQPEFCKTSTIGVCFPPDTKCSKEILEKLDRFLTTMPHFRAVYENLLTEQWDGLDVLYVLPEALTERGRRKILGFQAAGGEVHEIRGRGI